MQKFRQSSESRSRRRLESQLVKAADRHDRLLEEGQISLPSGLGRMVIIVSGAPNYKISYDPREQHRQMMREAERVREERGGQHQFVAIRPRAVIGEMKRDFADPEVTDI